MRKSGKLLLGVLSVAALIGTGMGAFIINGTYGILSMERMELLKTQSLLVQLKSIIVEDLKLKLLNQLMLKLNLMVMVEL